MHGSGVRYQEHRIVDFCRNITQQMIDRSVEDAAMSMFRFLVATSDKKIIFFSILVVVA